VEQNVLDKMMMALTTGAVVSMAAFEPWEDISNIYRDIN